jgi:2-C-methyl-D-erythritol 4-phosphate cytidylyltransferase
MKRIAIIIAGGSGRRMGQDIPKQFININDKPVIVYTLESFQQHPLIDAIEVVCLKGWESILSAYIKQFNLDKVKWIVPGGNSGQESIRNGVYALEDKCEKGDIVIIHDGVRPLIDSSILTDVIQTATTYGNGVTSRPVNEQIFWVGGVNHSSTTSAYIPREKVRIVATPQAYEFLDLDQKYHEAFEKNIGISGSNYTNTMMVQLGETLHFAAGSDRNIKLTTKDNLALFKAMLETHQEDWIK